MGQTGGFQSSQPPISSLSSTGFVEDMNRSFEPERLLRIALLRMLKFAKPTIFRQFFPFRFFYFPFFSQFLIWFSTTKFQFLLND